MSASKRVSLRDREERESNVRRALGAFITQPQETMDITKDTDVTDDVKGTKGTDDAEVTRVTDNTKGTHVTNGTIYTKGTPITEVTNDTQATGVTNVRRATRGTEVTDVTKDRNETNHKRVTKNTKGTIDTTVRRTADTYDVYAMRGRDAELPAPFMLKGRRFDPPVGARKRQNYALSSETIKRIALASAHAGVGKAELVDAVLCAALRDIVGGGG